jgi:hypothetical protein
MKEKLQQYALIAEIVGGIAIVCSLLFVGLQIRQNSQVSQVNAYQQLISQITLINTLRIENAEFAELFWRFDRGGKPRNDAESARLEAFLFMIFRHADLAWRQYDAGFIDRDGLISVLGPLRRFLNTEMGREMWQGFSVFVSPDLVAFVNELGLLCPQFTGTGSSCDMPNAGTE